MPMLELLTDPGAWASLVTLALAFLLLIGVALIADGFEFHIPRGYLYFGVAFTTLIEILNLIARKRRTRNAA
jgi:predicted tellurium resistance membrane protein TerC